MRRTEPDELEGYTEEEILNALDYLLQEGFIKVKMRDGEPYMVIADEATDL